MNVTSHAWGMGSSDYRALQRERERRSRQQQERSIERQPPPDRAPAPDSSTAGARRAAATTCGWCHGLITPRSRGPIPKWCSATCRHRAWEQARAASSGRSVVEIVERVVTVPAAPPAPAPRTRQRLGGPATAARRPGRAGDGLRPAPGRHRRSPRRRHAGRTPARWHRALRSSSCPGSGGDTGVTCETARPSRCHTRPGCHQSPGIGAFLR